MATCELCGAQTNKLTKIKVAGSFVNSCNNCMNLGQVQLEQKKSHMFRKRVKETSSFEVVDNYLNILKKAVSSRGIDLHILARATNIKESSLNKYFSGKIKPEIDVARKLESYLEIRLVDEIEATNPQDYLQDEDDSSLSLGDLLKKQLEKKND